MHWLSKMIRNIHLRRGRQTQLHLALTLFLNVNLKPTNTVSMTRRHHMLDHIRDLSSRLWLLTHSSCIHNTSGTSRSWVSAPDGQRDARITCFTAETELSANRRHYVSTTTHTRQTNAHAIRRPRGQWVSVAIRVTSCFTIFRMQQEVMRASSKIPLNEILEFLKKCMSFTRPLASVRPAALLRNAKNSELQWT